MAHEISKSEFKAKALEYFRLVESTGQTVFVTDRGRPTIEVRPFHSKERSPLDILRGSVTRYDNPAGPVDDEEWEAAK